VEHKHIAWSHSRISDFGKCARMFWFKYVDPRKLVPFKQTPAMKEGVTQHKVLEQRVRDGTPLPEKYAHYEPIAQAIINQPGDNYCEEQITFDSNFAPCGWFDKSAYIRVIIDVMKLHGEHAFAGDSKSGNPWKDEDQLKLTAAAIMQKYPEVNKVTTAYIWLKTGTIDADEYTRDMLPQMWEELMEKPRALHECTVMDRWPANPSQRNCRYCPVNEKGLCDAAVGRFAG
jgi:hypothetical protein